MPTTTVANTTWHARLGSLLVQHRASILALLILGGTTVAATYYWLGQSKGRLAAEKRAELERISEDELPLGMRELLAYGEPGIVEAVDALESNRPEVVSAARTALREELLLWRNLDPYDGTNRVAILASTLKDRMNHLRASEKELAAELATDILVWPLQGESNERLAIVRDCEDILRSSFDNRRSVASYSDRAEEYEAILDDIRQQRLASRVVNQESDEGTFADSNSALIAGDVPPASGIELFPATSGDSSGVPARSVSSPSSTEPNGFVVRSAPAPPLGGNNSGSTTPDRFTPPALSGESYLPEIIVDPSQGAAPVQRGTLPVGEAIAEPQTLPIYDTQPSEQVPFDQSTSVHLNYQWLPHIQLMKYLHSRDATIAAEAEKELYDRGFSPTQVEISRKVTHPDVNVRVAAIDELTNGIRFDPKPWLRWLCEDNEIVVRSKAIAFLATSNQSSDRQFVEQILQADRNAEIRAQIKWR